MAEPALAAPLALPPRSSLRVVDAEGSPGAPDAGASAAPAARRLQIPPYDMAAALRLEQELGVSHVLAQVLVRRGLGDPAEAREFLGAQERHPASAFDRIERAVATIEPRIADRSPI